MDHDYGSSSAGQTPGLRERLRMIREHSRYAWRRFHWSSGDTLALMIAAIVSVVMLLVLLQP